MIWNYIKIYENGKKVMFKYMYVCYTMMMIEFHNNLNNNNKRENINGYSRVS